MDYYSVKPLLDLGCHYSLSFGERSTGKTYSALLVGLKKVVKSNYKNQFAYLRRYYDDYKGAKGDNLFSALIENGELYKITEGKWNSITHKGEQWYFANRNESGVVTSKSDKPFMYGFALSISSRYKSYSYPNIKYIVFDEFISSDRYLENEFVAFQSILSTIIRDRNDVQVLLLGNTISKENPYFHELGIYYRAKYMQPGQTELFKRKTKTGRELRMAVEFTFHNENGKPSDVYFDFDGSSDMITSGVWEIGRYPTLSQVIDDREIKPRNIVFRFFVVMYDQILQGDVITLDEGDTFIFMHEKTTELKNKDEDLIYSLEYSTKPNWKRDIIGSKDKISKQINKLIMDDKIFYQSNVVGDLFKTYLSLF